MAAARRPTVAVIGAGPAGLMAAEAATAAGATATVFERMASPARKFLLAGRGGLNLTHSEAAEPFLARYGAAAPRLRPMIEAFDPAALRAWAASLGEPTVVGSSGRVFPQSFKASPLLRAWLRRLDRAGARIRLRHRWAGWTGDGALAFMTPDGPIAVRSDAVVLALGGASWPHLGADGAWTATLESEGIAVEPLRPSNCGFVADWSATMGERYAGHPLKGITLAFAGRTIRGEAMVTQTGLEGGAIYAVSAALRDAIAVRGEAILHIDFKPGLTPEAIARRLRGQPAKASLSTALRKALALSPAAIGMLQEARHRTASALPVETLVKAAPVRLVAPMPLARAISTAGGVRFDAVDDGLMLRGRPGVFVAGEMLNWEAPTGGYLLQASFATGAAAGRRAATWLGLDTS